MPEKSSLPSPAALPAALLVRAADNDDLDPLERIELSAFRTDRLSRRRIAAFVHGRTSDLLVAERAGAIAGYCLVLRRRGSLVARLYSIAVDPAQLGHGTGRRLLLEAEACAVRNGARTLRLEVRADNAAAIRLYAADGYHEIGRREHYYEDGATALRLEKSLSQSAPRQPAPDHGAAAVTPA